MNRAWIIVTALLSGCSGNYQFNSNIDPTNIKSYFQERDIPLLTEMPAGATSFGIIDANSCQTSANMPIANTVDAHNQLRQQAYQMGGNAIVLLQCASFTGEIGCLTSVYCSAKVIEQP